MVEALEKRVEAEAMPTQGRQREEAWGFEWTTRDFVLDILDAHIPTGLWI